MPTDDLASADDRALGAALIRRDEAAMAEVLRRHRGSVIAFARRLVGDRDRADEISQDVFARLWERSERFDAERGSLRTFLLAVTHGRALDVVRSDVSRRRREEQTVARTRPPESESDRLVATLTIGGAVRSALAGLPANEREAIELAYFHGHSYRAVAILLHEPEGTVKSRIRSGLSKMRAALANQDLQGS